MRVNPFNELREGSQELDDALGAFETAKRAGHMAELNRLGLKVLRASGGPTCKAIAREFKENGSATSTASTQKVFAKIYAVIAGLDQVREIESQITEVRLEALERRCRALETRKSFTYRGVFHESNDYQVDDFVTCSGSLWHASAPTSARPGSPGSPWKLAVKSGGRPAV